jgi:hypothetical protein
MDDYERDDASSILTDNVSAHTVSCACSISTEASNTAHNIDLLFDREQDAASWEPVRPQEVLGEFLDSRHMLPLLLPSDPVMLSATPKMPPFWWDEDVANSISDSRSASRASKRSAESLPWRITTKRLRDASLDILQWVDGAGSHAWWARQVDVQVQEEDEYRDEKSPLGSDGRESDIAATSTIRRVTPLTRRPSLRTKAERAPQ